MHQTQHLDPARPCLKLALARFTGWVHVFHGSPFQVSPAEASHIVVTQRSSVGLLCAECRERRVDRSTLPRKKISQKSQKTKAPPKKNRLHHLYLPSAMSRSTNRDLVLMGFLLTTFLIKNLDFFGAQICLLCSLSHTWVKPLSFFPAPTNKSQHTLWGLAGRSETQNLTKNKSKKKLNFKSKSVFLIFRWFWWSFLWNLALIFLQ